MYDSHISGVNLNLSFDICNLIGQIQNWALQLSVQRWANFANWVHPKLMQLFWNWGIEACVCSTEACACSTETCTCWCVKLMHMLRCRCAHAHLGAYVCTTGACTLTTGACTCSTEACTCSNEVSTCSTEACTCWCVQVKRAHAYLKTCVCSTESVHMLNWSVHMLNWECAHAHLKRAHAQLKCTHAQLKCTHADV